MPCYAVHPNGDVYCEYPEGHKADGSEVFAFHGGRTKTGKFVAWTDSASYTPRKPKQTDDRLSDLPFPPQRGEVYAFGSVTRDDKNESFQCEKVRDHAGNHIAHRKDRSMVVWA